MQILIRPIITEKTLDKADKLNQYTFEVSRNANKIIVAEEVAKKFNVKVKSVTMINYLGKVKSFGTKRIEGRRSDYKKALVTLDSKDKIDIFSIK